MARPEIKPKTPLGARLRAVRERLNYDEREQFAAELGISKAALAYYERGERVPDASTLAAYHERFGLDVTWLVTGTGGMFDDPSRLPPPVVEPELVERLYKAVEHVYRDMGQKPPPHRIAYEATTLFNVLLSRITDVRDKAIVDAVIPTLANELVQRLTEAAAKPGSGKRSAS